MKIKFIDLKKQYEVYKSEIDFALSEVINQSAFIKGKYVTEFENNFAQKCGVKHCIGVGNGTDAIYIVLKMLGIGNGDEVITTALSWISTSETISQVGAKPVFTDIDDFFLLDTEKLEEKITSQTKAIIPVHIYGQTCNMDMILKIASKYNLIVIEDCAQAHFAEYKGKIAGTFGTAATFSFYPGKNLGAYGDSGAIITNDDELAKKCRMYSNHGALIKHQHEFEGINSRLDGLQASILNVKLKYIDEWNEKRIKIAVTYNELLKNLPQVITPGIKTDSKHIFHIYCLLVDKRDVLKTYLLENGIETQIHYPAMLPFLPAYNYLDYSQKDFPAASLIQDKLISLPIFPELENYEIQYIVNKIIMFYA